MILFSVDRVISNRLSAAYEFHSAPSTRHLTQRESETERDAASQITDACRGCVAAEPAAKSNRRAHVCVRKELGLTMCVCVWEWVSGSLCFYLSVNVSLCTEKVSWCVHVCVCYICICVFLSS